MSFEKWYEEEKKKKKKETSDFESWYNSTKETTTSSRHENDDIAPVRLYSRTEENGGSFGKDEEDKPSWFQGGAFSDGYQFGDVSKTIIGTVADVSDNINTAVVDATENLIDTGAYVVGAVGGIFNEDFREDVGEFIGREILQPTQTGEAITKYTNPIGWANELINGGKTEENSLLGDKADGLVQSASHLVGSYALQMVGVPTWLTMGVNAFGSEIESAFQQDATYLEAGISGGVSAVAEVAFEKLSGAIKLGGGSAVDDGIQKTITKNISDRITRSIVKYGSDMIAEGGEEVATELVSAVGKKLTYASDKEFKEIFSTEDALDAFIGGAVMAGVLDGGRIVKSASDGTDIASGLTKNEEKVVRKIYEDTLAEKQKDGTKLNKAERDKLWDSIVDDMSKGQLNTDTIESVLGGDTYKSYQDVVNNEDAILKEFEELGKKQNPTLADTSRYNELKAKVDEINSKSNRKQLKTQLSQEVYDLVKGDKTGRLAESYNEVARKGVAFNADLTKYKGKQKEAVQRAIDSGVLNNTYRSHELVNILSKIEADKGITFDYTDNAKLKESGFAVEGKIVNGFVDKSTGAVTLNVQSAKSWQSVVGHEITHVLEGTKAYDALQKALYAYAESKGEYANRRANLTELYKGMGADIDSELTADLVGDYLFTDKDFVTHLTTNRNLFQKIYDEIKYLYKVATGKEQAEIAKVKKEFDKAWKELNVKDSAKGADTKLSISGVNSKTANSSLLLKAEHMLDTGVDSETVRQETGWFKGYDGKMRYEISDRDMDFNINGHFTNPDVIRLKELEFKFLTDTENITEAEISEMKSLTKALEGVKKHPTTLGDYLKHDKLYEAYPELKGFKLSFDKLDNGTLGKYRIGQKEIVLDNSIRDNKAKIEATLIHEIQHAIQEIEGFANGSSVSYWKDQRQDIVDTISGARANLDLWLEDIGYPDFVKSSIQEVVNKEKTIEQHWEDCKEFKANSKYAKQIAACEAELAEFQRQYDEITNGMTPSEQYENTAGEIEARDVSLRRWRSEEALKETRPDIDRENVVFADKTKVKYSVSTDSNGNELSIAVQKRFANSKAVDENGNLKVLYHGTYGGEFYTFDKAKGSVEGDFGSGFYFTDNEYDVERNYEGGGPDFENKVARRAEQIEGEEEIDYSEAEARAREELFVGSNKHEVYLNIENPAVVGETTLLDYESFAQEYDIDDYDSEEDYEGDVEQLIADTIDNVIWEVEKNVDVYSTDGLSEILWEAVNEGGIDIEQLKANINNLYLEDSEGNLVGSEVTRQIIESLGYDGIIDNTVSSKFSNMGLEEGTTHYIVFKPNQIKSVSNQTPTDNPDIRYSVSEETDINYMSAVERGDTKTAQLMVDEAAKNAGYDIKAYHGTGYDFTVFDKSKQGDNYQDWGRLGKGFYFAPTAREAQTWAERSRGAKNNVMSVYLRSENMLDSFEALPDDLKETIPAEWEGLTRRLAEKYVYNYVEYMQEFGYDVQKILKEKGYDGINGHVEFVVFDPEQIKSADAITYDDKGNTIPLSERFNTAHEDIRYSLSNEGEQASRTGDYNTPLNDLYYEGVAPVNVATDTNVGHKTDAVAPVVEDYSTTADSLEAQVYQAEETVLDIINEAEELERGYSENRYTDEEYNKKYDDIMSRYSDAMENHDRLLSEVTRVDKERAESLNDADVPPQVAPHYYGETEPITPESLFDKRDISAVGNRKVKAYMNENPEVKPFFQGEAGAMLSELDNSIKGERFRLDDGSWTGTQRYTSDAIAYLLDGWKYSYDQIEAGLRAIIDGNGKENNAVSKRIEFLLDRRLRKGYTDIVYGDAIPANQEYIDLVVSKSLEDYYGESFDNLVQNADKYVPQEDDIAPVNISPATNTEQKPVTNFDGEQGMFNGFEAEQEAPVKPQQQTAKILTEEPVVAKKKGRTLSKAVANFVDKGAVFENLSLKTKNRALQAKYNFMHYSNSKAQHFIANGAEGVKPLKTIFETVEKSGKTQQFYEYLYHYHNIDRMSLETAENQSKRMELRKQFQGYSDEAIKTIASEWITKDTPKNVEYRIRKAREYVEASKTKNKPVFGYDVTADMSRDVVERLEKANPEFKQWAQDVYSNNAYLRKLLVYNGVISPETADLWAKMYSHYVPIRRAGDTGLSVNVPLDTNRTGINAPVKKATGGNSDILPLFNTIAQRAEQTYKAIAKNNFGVELMNTLNSSVSVDKTATSLDDVIDSIDNHDGLLQEGKNGKNPTFTVFEGGERVTFEITEEMYDALKPTSEELSKTYKIPNAISNFRKATLTEYNPWFLLKNAIKDTQDVLINSQHAAKTYLNIPSAIKEMAANGKWYNEYIANGGEQNTYFDDETNSFKSENNAIEFAKKITGLNAISKANNVVEMLPRLAEYIASRKSGRSIEVSMLDAARVTTNFAAGGDITKFANRNGATFLNASVQGAMQQVRNIREAKMNGLRGWANLAAKYAIAGLPALLLNHLLWDDDEEYEELSDYVKQNYYIVGKYGDGKFVRIPKGRTVAVIQNAFEQMENAVTGDDEVDLKSFLDLVVSNLAPNNPLDNNIISPIIDVAKNETWYGEDLVPTRLQDVPESEQYDESTDELSKWLGEKLNYSPIKINYMLDQYSGVVGDTFLPMMTPEAESGDDSVGGKMIAPLKDMLTTDSVMKNQNISDFYDTQEKLTIAANGSSATDEDVLKSKYMSAKNAELSELYKQKREIQNSELSDKEKYNAVREVQKQIVDIARNSLSTYENVNVDGSYATVGDLHYHLDKNGAWVKVTDKQLEKQQDVTRSLGISGAEYWGNKEEYDYAYESPEKHAISKTVGGYDVYKTYSSELYDIKADKDENGKSINGSRKEKVIDYINNLDADYGAKIILFKSEYPSDDTYNEDIVNYVNNLESLSYEERIAIFTELGFVVSGDTVYWD